MSLFDRLAAEVAADDDVTLSDLGDGYVELNDGTREGWLVSDRVVDVGGWA